MLIQISGVTHRFGERIVLRDLDLTLAERRIGVIGANGSGKSTFARLLNGLVVPAQGRVRIDGLDTVREARAIRRRVGFCFTDPDAQIVMPTVAEDVAFGLRRLKLPKDQVQRRVGGALARAGLTDHADHPAHLLSGGQKQLLAITSILVTEPDLLVLDEPTTLLDLRNTRRIAAVVDGLPQQVVLVTHDLDLLETYDRVLVFDDARLVADAPPAEAVAHYRRLMSQEPVP
jgi:biotin transport system ATP-binding protein